MAHRIHECVQEAYWMVRSQPKIADLLIEADLHIHKIIEDYERRGMTSADAQANEPTPPSSAEAPAGLDPDPERVRRGGYLW